MSIGIAIALIISGILVGFINTLAGSGTIISISLLMFLGLPPNVANGTNRIGVFFQNIVAVASFKHQKQLDTHKGFIFSIPTALGSIAGSLIAVKINENIMGKVIGVMMLILLFSIIWKPEKWLKGKLDAATSKTTVFQIISFFFIGVYGGFIHLGVGIFILAITVLNVGYDLVKANAIKNLIVLCYTPFSLAIFIFSGLVNFKFGLIHSIGNMIGAYLASKWGSKWGTAFVRWLLIVVIMLASAKMLGVFSFIQEIIK